MAELFRFPTPETYTVNKHPIERPYDGIGGIKVGIPDDSPPNRSHLSVCNMENDHSIELRVVHPSGYQWITLEFDIDAFDSAQDEVALSISMRWRSIPRFGPLVAAWYSIDDISQQSEGVVSAIDEYDYCSALVLIKKHAEQKIQNLRIGFILPSEASFSIRLEEISVSTVELEG